MALQARRPAPGAAAHQLEQRRPPTQSRPCWQGAQRAQLPPQAAQRP